MAKKIVSILCALAMLATMVTVGMVSAFAGDGDTAKSFDGLNASATREPFNSSKTSATVEKKSGFFSLPGYGDTLIAMAHSKNYAGSIVTDPIGTYNLGSSFNFGFDVAANLNVVASADTAGSWGVSLGDLSIKLSQTTTANKWALVVKKGEDVITASETGDTAIAKYSSMRPLSGSTSSQITYNPNEDTMRVYQSDAFVSFWSQMGLTDNFISPFGLPRSSWGAYDGGSNTNYYIYYVPEDNYNIVYSKSKPWSPDAEPVYYLWDKTVYDATDKTPTCSNVGNNWFVYASHVDVAYDSGLLTVSVSKYLSNSDKVTFTYDLTSYGTSLGETAVVAEVVATPDTKATNGHIVGMSDFSGTYTDSTTGGDDGPVVTEDQEINLLDSTNIQKWSLNRSANYSYAGAVDLSEQGLTGIDGALSLLNTNSSLSKYVDFTYADAIDFGSDFSILMTAFIKTNLSGKVPTAADDTYVALTLGDYSIRLIRFAADSADEDAGAWNRCNFRIALYQGDTLKTQTDLIDKATTTTLYDGTPYTSNSSALGANGAVTTWLANNSPQADNTTVMPASSLAFNKDSGWKDITVTVKNGKLSVSTAAGVCKFLDPNGSYTLETIDVPEGTSFDGIQPVVRCYHDGALMKGQPTAVFRLQATIKGTNDTNLKPAGAYTSVNAALTANVTFGENGLTGLAEQGYTDVAVAAKIDGVSHPVSITKKDVSVKNTETGEYVTQTHDVAVIDFLTPDQFGTPFEIIVSAKKNGADAYFIMSYSIKEYCVNIMTNEAYSSNQELCKLCMSILQFAEAERLWKETAGMPTTDVSITADLDANLVSSYTPTSWDSTGKSSDWSYGAEDPKYDVTWVGANLNFKDEIGLNLYFTLPDGADPANYALTDNNGNTYSKFVATTVNDTSCYKVVVRISAAKLSDPITVNVTKGGADVSKSCTLSVEDWVLSSIAQGKLPADSAKLACAVAMMTYGDAAAAFAATL